MAGLLDFLQSAGLLGGGAPGMYNGPGSMNFGAGDPSQQQQVPSFMSAMAQAQPQPMAQQQAPQFSQQQSPLQAPQGGYAQQDPRLQGGPSFSDRLLMLGRPDLYNLLSTQQAQGAMIKTLMAQGKTYPEAAALVSNGKLQEDIYGNPKAAGDFKVGDVSVPNMVGGGRQLGMASPGGGQGGQMNLSNMLQLNDQMKQRQAQIGAFGKNQELTPEQKNAGVPDATGIPGVGARPVQPGQFGQTGPNGLPMQNANPVLNFEAQKKIQDQNITAGQKRYEGINAQSNQYERDLKPYLDVSKSILNDPNMYSGIGGNLSLDWNRVQALMGKPQAAVLQEALQKVTASSVLGQINNQRAQLEEAGGNSSRIFSQQVELVEKAAPALANTTAGNRFLVEVAQRMGDLSSRVAQEARDYRQQHGTLDTGFDQHLADYMKSHPIFSPAEMSNPQLLAAPTVPPGSANDQQSFMKWAQGIGLKSGDAVRGPNGALKVIP